MPTISQIIRTPQASQSTTFRLPDGFEDAKLPLPVVWDHHYSHSSNHSLFVYEDFPGSVKTISWKDAVSAMYLSASLVRDHGQRLKLVDNFAPSGDVGVFGILASTGMLLKLYVTLQTK